jgi:serine/threonine-protein kinase
MIVKGQKIDGRYQIIRTIGEGGMANVYLAYDTILEREVAVKILRGDLSNDEKFVKRFQREAKAASSLNHPNIVEMYDVGVDDNNYFIVMEYVNGKTLKSLIKKRGALSLSETIDIMLQLTSGIACAHDSYIIHRDLKPQNVMILEDGRVKITDFGIAVALNSAELTQTNSVMGSVHYLPPEQANGSGATVKSDIYSLGILMYELLTGKLPFKGENAVEIAIKQMKEKIPSVCAQNPNIPQSVENVILKACAKNPENRYESVKDMHDDLETVLLDSRKDEAKYVYPYQDMEEEETKVEEKKPVKEEVKPVKVIKKPTKEENKVNEIFDNKKTVEPKENSDGITKYKTVVGLIGMISLFIVIGILIFACYLLKSNKTKEVELPEIAGKTQEEVCKELDKIKVYYTWENEPSNDYEEGLVVGYKSRKPNSKVKQGTTVTIQISSGKSGFELEDYTKRNVNVVKIELENQGIKVITTAKKVSNDEEEYKDYEEGNIISQSKKAGSRIDKGGAIELVYATLVTVYPDFLDGKWDRESIQAFCDDNEIECDFQEASSSKKDGTILSQGRKEGVEVRKGVTLRIVIAKHDSSTDTPVEDDNTEETEDEEN